MNQHPGIIPCPWNTCPKPVLSSKEREALCRGFREAFWDALERGLVSGGFLLLPPEEKG